MTSPTRQPSTNRKDFAVKLGVFIRPRLHMNTEPCQPEVADPAAQAPQHPENESPTTWTPTTVVYVKVAGAVKGVMQLHKAAGPTLSGLEFRLVPSTAPSPDCSIILRFLQMTTSWATDFCIAAKKYGHWPRGVKSTTTGIPSCLFCKRYRTILNTKQI